MEGAVVSQDELGVAALPPALEIPDFEIVPRVGLIFAALAAVAVVVAIAVDKLWPLMFLHVT